GKQPTGDVHKQVSALTLVHSATVQHNQSIRWNAQFVPYCTPRLLSRQSVIPCCCSIIQHMELCWIIAAIVPDECVPDEFGRKDNASGRVKDSPKGGFAPKIAINRGRQLVHPGDDRNTLACKREIDLRSRGGVTQCNTTGDVALE